MEYPLNIKINKEKNRIKRELKSIPQTQYKIVEKLVARAAFTIISLEEIEEIILRDGYHVTMPQGAYDIDRAHPLLDKYISMLKIYSVVIKQLCDLLPDADKARAGDELMKFATMPKAAK